jgi:hypothetical protein
LSVTDAWSPAVAALDPVRPRIGGEVIALRAPQAWPEHRHRNVIAAFTKSISADEVMGEPAGGYFRS